MDSFDILVIILSVALAIFIGLATVLVVVLIKLVNQIREITKKAEEIVEDVESVSSFFKHAAPKVAITSLLSNIVSKISEMKHNKEK